MSITKRFLLTCCIAMIIHSPYLLAEDVTVVPETSEAAQGLDLGAVAQLVQEVDDGEALERALNDPEVGINNLDLDDDGNVDYIRVVGQNEGNTHVLILQVPLGPDEYQDVATIEVEKDDRGEVALQLHGNTYIYGPDYYVVPTGVAFASLAFVSWLYSPIYRPYRSVYTFGVYPRWYRPWPVVSFHVYRPRVTHYTRVRVHHTHVTHVHHAHTVYRAPTVSVRVKKPVHHHTKTTTAVGVRKKPNGSTTVGAKRVKTTPSGKKTTTTVTKKKKTNAAGKTTVTTKKKKTTKKGNKKTTTVTKTKKKKK